MLRNPQNPEYDGYALNTQYDGYQRGFANMVYKVFDKKVGSGAIATNKAGMNAMKS